MKPTTRLTISTVALTFVAMILGACSSSSHLSYKDRDDTYFTGDDRIAQKGRPDGIALPTPLAQSSAAVNGKSTLWQGGRPIAEVPSRTATMPDSGDEYYKPGYINNNSSSYSTNNRAYNNAGGFGGMSPSFGLGLVHGNNPYFNSGFGGNGFNNCFSCNPYINDPFMANRFNMGNNFNGFGYNSGWGGLGYSAGMAWGNNYGFSPYGNGNFGFSPFGYGNFGYSPFYDPYGFNGFGYNPYAFNPYGFNNNMYGFNNNIYGFGNMGNNNGLVTVVTDPNSNNNSGLKGPANRSGDGLVNPNNRNVPTTNGNGVGTGLSTSPDGFGGRGRLADKPTVGNNVNNGTALSREATAAQVIDINPGAINRPTLNIVQDGGLVVPVSPEASNASYYVRPSNTMIGNGNNVAFPAYTPSSYSRTEGSNLQPSSPNRNDYRNDNRNNVFGNYNSGNDGGGSRGSYSGGSSGGGSSGGSSPNVGSGGGGR